MSDRRVTHWVNEAYAALGRGDIHGAAKAADRARDANRRDPRVQLLSGHLLIMCSAHEEGLTALERAEVGFRCANQPVPGQLYCSRAVAFMKLFRHAEAAHWFRVAIDADPNQPEPYIGLGTTFMDRGDDEQAGLWFAEATRRFPGASSVRWGRAMYRLRQGEWPEAWRDYEMRLLAPDWLMRWGHTRQQAKPWDGQPIPGQSLVVFHEQGQGDTIMLTRYLPWLRDASQCAKLCLLVPDVMMGLVDTGIADWIGHQNPPPPIDYSLPFTSLPYFHQTRADTVPPCLRLAA